MKHLKLSVKDPADLHGVRPVTGGVPLACGAAPRGSTFTLKNDPGKIVPLQTSVLRRWPDGSAQWVLLDFQANGAQNLTLSWPQNAKAVKPDQPVVVGRGQTPTLRTGNIKASLAEDTQLHLADRFEVVLSLTDHRGRHCRGVVQSTDVETAGALRSSMVLTGAFYTAGDERVFGFRLRVTLFAGLRKVRLEPIMLIDADTGMMQKVRDLTLHLRPRYPVIHGTIGGEPQWQGKITDKSNVRLFQHDDLHYVFQGTRGKGRRAPGWAQIDDGHKGAAVAMREFWQQWPKGMAINKQEIAIELLPRFKAGTFKHMDPWYKYQTLFDGTCYCLRTGQTRRWDIWVDLDGDGSALAAYANTPLILVADPKTALATGVWGDITTGNGKALSAYDQWAENQFDKYAASIEHQRDYGEMNWGDWFGERYVNWGNHEYDTSNVILSQFARTGDPKYFYTGCAAGRHTSEVDTIHFVNDDLKAYFERHFGNPNYPIRPGMMHEHCIGHVGGFASIERIRRLFVSFGTGQSKRPYLCLDPYNLGHVFTEGLCKLYFLTGDPWLRETVLTVGDNLAMLVRDREYAYFKNDSHSGRVNGWTMLALAAAYEVTPAQRYLRAMKLLADDALEEQDPHSGGWHYELPNGHCQCKTKKHVGEAGFIGSIRINGLCRYYQLSGDKRIPPALKRYIDHLIRDTWDEQLADWRYTSCPATPHVRQIGVTIRAMVHSVRITGDPEHERVLAKAWRAKFDRLQREARHAEPQPSGAGKLYSVGMYGSSEAATCLAQRGLI